MKTLKLFSVVAVLAGLFTGLAPQPGVCGMSERKVFVCEMPCCDKPTTQAPVCPMIRPDAPHDLIALSSTPRAPHFESVAILSNANVEVVDQPSFYIQMQPQIPKQTVFVAPSLGRSPPQAA